jgi:hypothetical protein
MPTTARLVDEYTGEVIQIEYDDGDPQWCDSAIFTSSLDLGFAAPRAVVFNSPDVNGAADLTELHGDRVVTWNGYIRPTLDDPFPAIVWDKIKRLCAPNRRPYLFVQENGWNEERRMVVRCDAITAPLDRQYGPMLVVSITWRVAKGVLESSTLNQLRCDVVGGTGGRCITSTGYCFGSSCVYFSSGSFGGATIVTNEGGAVTYPIIVFTGPAKNPRVYDPETNLGVYLNVTLSKGQQVAIDTQFRNVQEPATPPINRLSWWDFTKSSWITLESGDNELIYTSDDKQGICTIYWRDRWL